jgi:protein SPIRAL1 and related proteins
MHIQLIHQKLTNQIPYTLDVFMWALNPLEFVRAIQNSGNFITDRSTTRLHAPPGGASSFSIGHMGGGSTSTVDPLTGKQSPKARSGPDPYTGRGTSSLASYVAAPASYSPAPAPAPAPAPTLASAPAQYQAPGQQQQTFGARVQGSSNDYQRSSAGNSYGGINGNGSQNTGNFLSDRPTSRVLAPPGGGSSITFG